MATDQDNQEMVKPGSMICCKAACHAIWTHPIALQTAHRPRAWEMLQPKASSTKPPVRHPTMPVPEVTAANMLSAVGPDTLKISAPALGPRNVIDSRVPACTINV